MTSASSRLCKGCLQRHVPIPLHGPLSLPFRLVGIRPSRMNPNTCTICETAFTRVMKARSIVTDATVMFADLRGYTTLSQSWPTERMTALLDNFYDECATAIWRHDGLLNKTIGDAVMAIFNFPIRQADHTQQAVLAAKEIQQRFPARVADLQQRFGADASEVGIGIGLDCGKTNFGEFGNTHRDLTAIGTVVNLAARAQAAARPGEILVTPAVNGALPPETRGHENRYSLKGFEGGSTLYRLAAS